MRFALIAGLTLCSCAGILGIEDRVFDASAAPDNDGDGGTDAGVAGCTTHAQCGAPDASVVCIVDEHRCAELRSDDCPTVTGAIENGSVVVASLLSTKGAQAATNIPRQNAAALAVEEINSYGGVPIGGARRKLVLVSCDESTNLTRVASHLVEELKVPAMVGPNLSQDVIDLTNRLTAASGTLLMTPTAVASSITDLADRNLTWRNVPSDVQRAPLMVQQINALETQIKAARNINTIKLAIIWRNDALGLGTFNTLSTMTLNGRGLSDASNAASVRIDGYDVKVADQAALVSKYIAFQPDIVAAIGAAEVVTRIMLPIEAGWGAGPRPVYLMIDSGKVPELISAVTSNDDLRRRVRGTGVTPTDRSKPVYGTFALNYKARYGDFPDISGMAAAYDGLYAIGFAMAAQGNKPLTGSTIALGLRSLTGGLTEVRVGPTEVTKAFTELEKGTAINVVGTLGPFEWDANGDALGSLIEMWCIGKTGSTIAYGSSGITYNTKTQMTAGTYTQCP